MADPKTVSSLRQAGSQALARAAYREASQHFEQALDALGQLPGSRHLRELAIDLRFDLHAALLPLGEAARGFTLLREAAELANALHDTCRLGRAADYMTFHYWFTGRADQAATSGQRALRLAATCGEFTLQIAARQHLGLAYYALGNYAQALEIFEQMLEHLSGDLRYKRLGLANPPAITARVYMAGCYGETGNFVRGSEVGSEAVRLAETLKQPSALLIAYQGIGSLYLRRGDLVRALPVLERGLQLCNERQTSRHVATFAAYLGYALGLSGRHAEALQTLEQATQHLSGTPMLAEHAIRLAWLSEGYLLTERLDEAIMYAKQAFDLAQLHKERGTQAWVLRLLGTIASYRGPSGFRQAEEYFHQALVLATELGMRPLVAHCRLGLGTIYNQILRVEPARAELSTAIDLYRGMDMPFWLSRVGVVLAR